MIVMKHFPDISIVVVTWNVADALAECLTSLDQTADVSYELFVIDNGSTDTTPKLLDAYAPNNPLCVRYDRITNALDLGYSTAANMGIRRASAPFVLLLNPDTVVTPQALSGLVAEGRAHPEAGIIGCRIVNSDGSHQSSVSELPTLRRQIEHRLGLSRWSWYARVFRRPVFHHDYASASNVPQIKGAVALLTTPALAKVGQWDDGYFLWFEDSDYCKRVQDAGLTVRYTPAVTVAHRSQAGIAKMPFWERFWIWNRSIRRYFWRHHGPLAGILIAICDPLAMFLGMAAKRVRSV